MKKIKKVLVTGGCGFIGSHTVDALVKRGYEVRILDVLEPQVHGTDGCPPEYLNRAAELIVGDVRSRNDWLRALQDVDAVMHFAAVVGVGQSMYEIQKYVEVNSVGTALLLELVVSENIPVRKVIVASSMSNYGEGAYQCTSCGGVDPELRPLSQMRQCDWEVRCPVCASALTPVATKETHPMRPTSVYAISKRDQEELCMTVGKTYGIPVVALRYFNVYGPRQALSNPYTGVIAIFACRLLNGEPPLIYEDGRQSRDFIHINDIVRANILALENDKSNFQIFNVGTGRALSILDVAKALNDAMGSTQGIEVVERFRKGDIRHCYADTSKSRELLGFESSVRFEDGIREFISWLRTQEASDQVQKAVRELEQRGLLS